MNASMSQGTAEWCGYTFDVYEPDDEWYDVPGVYIFAVRQGLDWQPLYVGETGSFKDRLGNLDRHHDWEKAVALGVTHVHALKAGGHKDRRQTIEGAIYDEHKPKGELPLNDKVPPGSKQNQAESYLPKDWY